ncbi:MAG: response regulator [Cellulomonas sp.]|uniref:response regulator n=1 Tax=Cellulomonas sp. TaxID=40001 RepID=UPI00258B7A26|nr:response regulator [Cellulomonas sp.]MCR6706601.1 response regulator [Cellulomonas sp.]
MWVDDHPENNQVKRRFLRRAGAIVINALSTHEALGEPLRDDIDVIVTDFERAAQQCWEGPRSKCS